MKKDRIAVICLVVLILVGIILIFCFAIHRDKKEVKSKNTLTSGTVNGITYKAFECDHNYADRGFYLLDDSYIIASGLRHYKGASITIVKIKIDKDKNARITVKETSAEEENPDISVYPTVCFTLSGNPKTVTVVDVEGIAILQRN